MAKVKYEEINLDAMTADTTIPATIKKNALKITGSEEQKIQSLYADGNDLVFVTNTANQYKIILKDYFAKNGKFPIKTLDIGEEFNLADTINKELAVQGAAQIITTGKKGTFKGTVFNDTITATDGKDKIYGYGGNDLIYAGAGDDTITGGDGVNTLVVSTSADFGNKTVVLTKGETFGIQFSDKEGEDVYNYLNIEPPIEGNDFVLRVYSEPVQYDEVTDTYVNNSPLRGTITIKNFAKKDVLTDEGALLLLDSEGNNIYGDLRNLYKYVMMDGVNYKGSSYTGYWLDDDVDASGYVAYKKKVAITDENTKRSVIDKTKGVKINLGGSMDENYATGSIYADTIKGGANDDYIEGGRGNDVITGGKGENTIVHHKGDGADVINLTKGENLRLELDGINEEYLFAAYTNKNKDLKLYYTDETGNEIGSVTLKNFAKKDVTNTATKKNPLDTSSVILKINGYTLGDLRQLPIGYEVTKNHTGGWLNDLISAEKTPVKMKKGKELTKGVSLNGKGGNDYIIGSNYYDTIKGGAGNDTLIGGKGNDKLYGEAGENLIVFNSGDGNDTVYSGKGNDTLQFAGEGNAAVLLHGERVKNAKGKDTNDLLLYYGLDKDSSILVKDFYKKTKKGDWTTSVKYYQIGDGEALALNETIISGLNSQYQANVLEGDGSITAGTNTKYILSGANNDFINLTSDTLSEIMVGAGEGNNTIVGNTESAQNYIIMSGSGNDMITTGSGNDTIKAGDGNNTIMAGEGENSIISGKGDDFIGIYFEDGDTMSQLDNINNSYINAGDGDNRIYANGYNTIISGSGNDEIYADDYCSIEAGAGDDSIISNNDSVYGASHSTINAGEGNNNIKAKDNNSINSGSGNDYILVKDDNNIYAGAGNNTISAEARNYINTGSGDDYIGGSHTFHGGSYSDEYNTINAGDGNNTIYAGRHSHITSGSGNDKIATEGSCDIVSGAGNDTISFIGNVSGEVSINPGKGDDVIDFSENTTSLDGAYIDYNSLDGSDTIIGAGDISAFVSIKYKDDFIARKNGRDIEIVTVKDGELSETNKITIQNYYREDGETVANENIRINGISPDDAPNNFIKGEYVTINGTSGNDYIYGTSGNDTISVVGGSDVIKPGAGNDYIDTTGQAAQTKIYFLRGEGDLTVKNTNGFMLYTDIDTLTGSAFTNVEKRGTTAVLTRKDREGAQTLTIENAFDASGTAIGTIDFLDTKSSNIGKFHLFLQRNDVTLDVYPDADGNIVGYSGAENMVYHATEAANTMKVFNGGNNITIVGVASSDTPDTIDMSFIAAERRSHMTWERGTGDNADDLVITDVDNNNVVTIKDFYATDKSQYNLVFDDCTIPMIYDGENLTTSVDLSETADWRKYGTGLNDSLVGGTQNYEEYNAGKGNDTIVGRTDKQDEFRFTKGDGNDTITNAGTLADIASITNINQADGIGIYGYANTSDTNFKDWEYEVSGRNLIIKYNHVNNVAQDSVTIENYFDASGNVNSSIQWGIVGVTNTSSSIKKLAEIFGKTIDINHTAGDVYGSPFNDSISGSNTVDHVYAGDGNDTLQYSNSTVSVTLEGGAGDDSLWGGIKDNRLIGGKGNDTIVSKGGNDYIDGGLGTDFITAGAGNDTIYVNENDTVNAADGAGKGDDEIYLSGSATIRFAKGDGNDCIYNNGSGTLQFTDVAFDEFTKFEYNSASNPKYFEINYGTSDTINIFGNKIGNNSPSSLIDLTMWIKDKTGETRGLFVRSIPGDNSPNYAGSSLSDYVYGSTGNDTFQGNWGDDTIWGNTGDDTFIFNSGDGNDIIYGANGNTYSSTLVFQRLTNTNDIVPLDFSALNYSLDGNDLLISYDYNEETTSYDSSVRLIDYVSENNSIKNIKAGVDGDVIDKTMSEVLAEQHIYIGASDDSIMGSDGDDTIISLSASSGGASILAGAGDDSISAGAGNDSIYGGVGNDIINADKGVNNIYFSVGDGEDIVNLGTSSGNVLNFEDINFNELRGIEVDTVTGAVEIGYGTDDVVTVNGLKNNFENYTTTTVTADIVTDDKTMHLFYNSGSKTGVSVDLVGTDDNDYIVTGTGGGSITGGKGDDTISVTGGGNMYAYCVFNSGDGNDVIMGAVTNTLKFNGMTAEDLNYSLTNDYRDLLISYDYNDETSSYDSSVTIKDYAITLDTAIHVNPHQNVNQQLREELANYNNITISTSMLTNISGNAGNNTLIALAGSTRAQGFAGSDTIVSYANGISIYTYMADSKDTISSTCDTVDARGKNNSIYAQSATNIISSSDTQSNDSYYAYIDQKTSINDAGGNSDSFSLVNTYGKYDAKLANTYLLFDDSDDVIITNAANKDLWAAGSDFKGITIKDNAVETVSTSDDHSITSTNIALLKQYAASWLADNSTYASVAEMFDAGDSAKATAYAAAIQEYAEANSYWS